MSGRRKWVIHLNQKIERLISQRSRLLVNLLWAFLLLDMSKFLADDRPLLWLALVGLGLLAVLSFMVYYTEQARISMYVMVVMVHFYAFLLITGRPSAVNYMFVWIGLMISALYQEYGPIFLAAGLTVVLQAFAFLAYGKMMFPTSRPVDIIYPLLMCTVITVSLLYLTKFTKRLWLSAEQAEQAEQRLRHVLSNVDVVTWAIKRFDEGPIVSEGLGKIAGLTAEQLCEYHNRWTELIHRDDLLKVQAVVNDVVIGKRQVVEFRVLRPDGGIRWVQCRATPVADTQGHAQGMQGVLIDITQRKSMEQQITFLAYHDVLTGLPNRTLFFELSGNSLLRARRDASMRAAFFIDLDGFKQVNDTAGHNIGDQVLAQVAQRLRLGLRGGDILCRLGGDEFAVLLEIKEKSEVVMVAERIIELVSQPITVENNSFAIGCSIGISYFPDHGLEADSLLKSADQAMYQAKAGKENAWRVYRPEIGEVAGAAQL